MEWDQPVFRKAFTTSIDDQVRTQRELVKRVTPRGSQLKRMLLLSAIIFVVTYVINDDSENRLLFSLLQSAAFPILLLAMAPAMRWAQSRVWKSHLRTHFGPGPYATEVEIGDLQLIHRFEDLEQRFAWRAMQKLEADGEELRIFIAQYGLVRIPGAGFDSETEKRQWMDALERKTGLSFS